MNFASIPDIFSMLSTLSDSQSVSQWMMLCMWPNGRSYSYCGRPNCGRPMYSCCLWPTGGSTAAECAVCGLTAAVQLLSVAYRRLYRC